MRIERVELRAFGHFVDGDLELDHPPGGLRFVVGPNEAGKSTLRAALRAGLFGFDARQVAGRPTASTAVTLHLADGGGAALVVARHGAGAPRDGAGRPIEPAALERWVGVAPEAFDGLFCLGHDELRRYGHDLLQSGADLGRIVFGAALGGARLQKIGHELGARLDELFTPGGRVKKLNRAVAELAEVDERMRTMTVSAASWDGWREGIDRLGETISEIDRREAARGAASSRLHRIQVTAPFRAGLRQHRADLAALHAEGVTPTLGVATRVEALLRDREAITSVAADRQRAIDGLRRKLEGVGTDRSALDRSGDVTELHQQVAGYREARERVRRYDLGVGTTSALVDAGRLIAAVEDGAPLRTAAHELTEMDERIAGERAELAIVASDLGLSDVRDADLHGLRVPSEGEIEAARDDAARRAAHRTGLVDALDGVVREVGAAEVRLRALESGGASLPTDAEIDAARADRDRSWGAVREQFVDDARVRDGVGAREGLAREVETGISRADALVDRVRDDTERASKVRSEQRQWAGLRDRQQQLVASVAAADDEARGAIAAWRARWAGVTDRVGTPKEMSAWRARWRELCQRSAALAVSIARAEQRRVAVGAAAHRLRDALAASGHVPARDAGLPSLLSMAEDLIEAESRRLVEAEEAAEARARVRSIDARLADLVPLLGPDASERGDRAIEALDALRNAQARDRDHRREIEGQLAEAAAAWAESATELARLDARVREEAAALGVDVDRLPSVVARARRGAELEQRIDEVERRLLAAGDGLSLADLQAEADAAGDVDAIAARLAALEQGREDLQGERTEAIERRSTLRDRLRASAGDDATASLAEARERVLCRIATLLEEIALLTLATSLLERVVDAARATGRGPLLTRASHYFALLTDGAFERLDLELVGEEAFPVAIRSDGSRLYPVALSDGTLDQLWLAWRLAGVEHHLDRMGPVPLIVDDVLVNFDDARAGSAFDALASLAERTQVLVITHHPHLVEVARARLGGDRVVVTDLGARPTGAGPSTQLISAGEALGRPPVPRPPAPARPAPRPAAGLPPARDATVAALLAAVDGTWRGKAELLARSGVAATAWNAAIGSLLASGSVEQQGEKRGARYRRASPAGSPTSRPVR